MDDFSLEGELFRDTLDKLETINRTLGGNVVTINGVKKLIQNQPKDKTITIIDLGCGHGDILRDIAKFGRKRGFNLKLIGIDANPDAIEYANELSEKYHELTFEAVDIFSSDFQKLDYDVALCTLFAHHFKDDELKGLLKTLVSKASLGVVVNDLHRHRLAYYLFKLIGLFIKNRMVREDGLTSILRAFKRKDLEQLSAEINAKANIRWKWAFRYQWILTSK
jgi:2-polyprenyl-3-methyl-5-hydroxy-6-metoxy-1,4-benzoquinol methylase